MQVFKRAACFSVVFIFLSVVISDVALAGRAAGEVITMVGRSILKRAGKTYRLAEGVKLKEKDVILTGRGAKVVILLADGSTVTLLEGTQFVIRSVKKEKRRWSSLFTVFLGKARFVVSKIYRKIRGSSFQVQTPTAVTGVRGTEFAVMVGQDGSTQVYTFSGEVFVRDAMGSERYLTPGRFVVVSPQGEIATEGSIPPEQKKAFKKEFDPEVPEEIPQQEESIESEFLQEMPSPPPQEEEGIEEPETPLGEDEATGGGVPADRLDPEELKGRIRFRFR